MAATKLWLAQQMARGRGTGSISPSYVGSISGGMSGSLSMRYGTATSDSHNGWVQVKMDMADSSISCIANTPITEGQRVAVLTTSSGQLKAIPIGSNIADAAIETVDVEYASGTSSSTAPESGWSTESPEWEQGRYIWQRTKTVTQSGATSYSEPVCIQGAQGEAAIGVSSTSVTYAVSSSGTTAPSSGWSGEVPDALPGQYLWSRTVTYYTDGTESVSYGVSYQGSNGQNGDPGAPGVGIASSDVSWQASNSGTTVPTGKWSQSVPDLDPGQYLWTRTVWTYTDGDSTTTYSVSRFGENGAQGIQGPPGEDGQPLYTWIKYADTPTSGMSDRPDGKTYMGIAYNKESATESSIYSDYQWSLIKGADGAQGVQGPPGKDGRQLYTWLKYADTPTSGMSDSPNGKTYMGIAYNKESSTESSIYSDYAWSLIKGADGVQGPPGEDGTTLYTWIKYATSASGANMSDNPTGRDYIGIAYNKTTATESTTPRDYQWSLIKGADGAQGVQGPPGKDGRQLYTWLKYADTPTSGMSDSPNGKTYMGIAYNKESSTESSIYSDYAWSLIKGADGVQGPPGEDGTTLYTWIKYATSASGANMSDNPTGRDYIGIAYNKTTATESTTPRDYQWSLIKGADGAQGIQGPPGEDGTTLYTWIKYATSDAGANMSDNPTGRDYIGIAYNKTTATESTNPKDYAWSLIQGETGIGVKDIREQYYLSTSDKSQTGGSWTTTCPEWKKDHYIWTRSQITWTDKTVTYTTPVLASALNQANEKADVSTWYTFADEEGTHVVSTPNDATTGPNVLLNGYNLIFRDGTEELASFSPEEFEMLSFFIHSFNGSVSIGGNNLVIGSKPPTTSGWDMESVGVKELVQRCAAMHVEVFGDIASTATNTWAEGVFYTGNNNIVTFNTGTVMNVDPSRRIYIQQTGVYKVSLYGAVYSCSSGDLCHFGLGTDADNILVDAQQNMNGNWGTIAKTALMRVTEPDIYLKPFYKCEQGYGSKLATNTSSVTIEYLGVG